MLLRIKKWVYTTIGEHSPNFRDWWYRYTGTWLWGLDSYMLEHPVCTLPNDDFASSLSREAFMECLDKMYAKAKTETATPLDDTY